MPDIIFIGAGPIGLLGATQLKIECPETDILMFEKYEDPVRNHAMYAEQDSFSGMNKSQGFGELLRNIPSKVIISDMEKMLRAYAESIGIKIQYEEIKDFSELRKRYPYTKYFVGSGGLRGIIHPQVFNSEKQIDEPLRYAIEVKYKAQGATRALNKFLEVEGVLAHGKHTVSEYVGHEKEGLTPVSLRIFINEETYQAMKGATFKSPYTLTDKDKIPADLFKSITNYLKGRKHIASEVIQENSLKISTITLSLYASKEFCKTVDGVTVFELGEEGFACPFYRSFNDNAKCIPYFTKAMKALFAKTNIKSRTFNPSFISNHSTKEETPLEYYQRMVQGMVTKEIRTIHAFDFGIEVLEQAVSSSQKIPQLSGSKLRFKQGGRDFLHDVGADEKTSSSQLPCTIL